jgi:hypothetical protein
MNLRPLLSAVLLFVLSLLCASDSSAFFAAGPQSSLIDTESPFLSSETKNAHLSDRENVDLRGPVSSSTEENIPSNGTKFVTTEYSRDGRLLTKRMVYPNNPDFLSTWIYDVDGRLVEIAWESSDKPMETREYDELGRLKTVIRNGFVSIHGDAQVSRTDVHYDEQGHKTTVQHFDPALPPAFSSGYFRWDSIVDSGEDVPKGGSVTMLYDENDQPTELQVLGADGHMIRKIVRVYNQNGLVIQEKPNWENPASDILARMPAEKRAKLSPEEVKQMYQTWSVLSVGKNPLGTFYTYDEKNRLTKICERNDMIEKTITITYNDHGDKVEKKTAFADNFNPQGRMDPFVWNGPPMSERIPDVPDVHYVYKYDSAGNWIERIRTASNGSKYDVLPSVTHRTLSYYQPQ